MRTKQKHKVKKLDEFEYKNYILSMGGTENETKIIESEEDNNKDDK